MYGRTFAQMYTGSMFGKPPLVWTVLGYIIANQRPASYKDPKAESYVELNPVLLAAMFASTVEEIEKALLDLEAPDPNSRDKRQDGRRIVLIGERTIGPRQYWVVNGRKYRTIKDDDQRREQNRAAKQRERERKQVAHGVSGRQQPSGMVSKRQRPSRTVCPQQQASAHEDVQEQVDTKTPPTPLPDSRPAESAGETLKARLRDNAIRVGRAADKLIAEWCESPGEMAVLELFEANRQRILAADKPLAYFGKIITDAQQQRLRLIQGGPSGTGHAAATAPSPEVQVMLDMVRRKGR
jgi:hypothetical protein